MDLLQLHYFRTVARLEHMTRAAEELLIAQPALSQTIARLEDELGVLLFDRLGRRIRLNLFGKAFLEHVERIFAELDQGQQELADLAGGHHGQVELALGAATHLLPDLLSAFHQHHPHISFHLFHHSVTTMVKQLEHGAFDFCITAPPLHKPGIASISLLTEDIVLALPAGHRLAERTRIHLVEVADEAFLSLKPGQSLRDLTDAFCLQAGFTPKIVFESDDPSTIRGLIRAGQGIAFVPAISWRGSTGPAVAQVQIEEPICQRTIGLSWVEHRYLSLAALQFREFVSDYFAQLSLE